MLLSDKVQILHDFFTDGSTTKAGALDEWAKTMDQANVLDFYVTKGVITEDEKQSVKSQLSEIASQWLPLIDEPGLAEAIQYWAPDGDTSHRLNLEDAKELKEISDSLGHYLEENRERTEAESRMLVERLAPSETTAVNPQPSGNVRSVGELYRRWYDAMANLNDEQKSALQTWSDLCDAHERASLLFGPGESDAFVSKFVELEAMIEDRIKELGAGDALSLITEKAI